MRDQTAPDIGCKLKLLALVVIVGALCVAPAGLSVIDAATAYGQIDTRSQYGGTIAAVVDDRGNLRVPADYRTAYQMLGKLGSGCRRRSGLKAAAGGLCIARNHRRVSQGQGTFPDGTVLVKEVFNTTTEDMTTGTVSSAHALAGSFVMVKDNVGLFLGNKLWSDSWAWS